MQMRVNSEVFKFQILSISMNKKAQKTAVIITILIMIAFVLLVFVLFKNKFKNPEVIIELSTYDLTIDDLNISCNGYCYLGKEKCQSLGCEHCNKHPGDCDLDLTYKVSARLPPGKDYIDCEAKIYIDNSAISSFENKFQLNKYSPTRELIYPYSIGDYALNTTTFEFCCQDVCIGRTQGPICPTMVELQSTETGNLGLSIS